MTDRIKGYLVTIEDDIRDDDAKIIQDDLKMIKGVFSVKPYVKRMEDYMSENKARMELTKEIVQFLYNKNN